MHIDSYRFGTIVIDGTSYENDVILYRNGIHANWFRREGHRLFLDDIQDYIDDHCTTLIVGTGAAGMLRVMPDVRDFCEKAHIELIAHPTAEAIRVFNNADGTHIVGAFHLTC